MATKPSTLPEWNSGGLNRTTPNGAKLILGWTVDEEPPSSTFNWWMNNVYSWTQYVDDLEAQDLTWTGDHVFDGVVTCNANVSLASGADLALGAGSNLSVAGTSTFASSINITGGAISSVAAMTFSSGADLILSPGSDFDCQSYAHFTANVGIDGSTNQLLIATAHVTAATQITSTHATGAALKLVQASGGPALLIASGGIQSTGASVLTGAVSGVTTLNASGAITGASLVLSGSITGATTGAFSGAVTVGGTLGVTGGTTLSSTLGVTGLTTVTSLTANSAIISNKTFTAQGSGNALDSNDKFVFISLAREAGITTIPGFKAGALVVTNVGTDDSPSAQFFGGASNTGPAVEIGKGQLKMVSTPATTTGFSNTLTPLNIPKAWGLIRCGSSPTLVAGSAFNISSITIDDDEKCTVTFATGFTSATAYGITFGYSNTTVSAQTIAPVGFSQTSSSFRITTWAPNGGGTFNNDIFTSATFDGGYIFFTCFGISA